MLNAAEIIAEAEDTVGIADSDTFVRNNLERLVDSINTESHMSPAGFASARRTFLLDTVNRLEGLKWLRDFPEIADEPIERPVFLMGLPRSGTTYCQYLFDCDSRFRLIRTWEAISPSPPAGADPASAEARRITWAERRRQLHPPVPGFEALHLYDEDGSEECHAFMEQTFGAAGLNNLYRVPSYYEYLLDKADLEGSYRVHKRQLQLLQWRSARRPWALKYPNHSLAVSEILHVYPDARFVMTHRDPLQTLASISKMSSKLRGVRADNPIDLHDVGRYMTRFVQRNIERIMDVVDGPLGDRISHVDYYALVDDPVSELLRVHAELGIGSPEEVQTAVRNWHKANPKNNRGANDYALVEYGINGDALAEQFADYMRRFNIPRERDGLTRRGAGL
jgi:hypothetical protein